MQGWKVRGMVIYVVNICVFQIFGFKGTAIRVMLGRHFLEVASGAANAQNAVSHCVGSQILLAL